MALGIAVIVLTAVTTAVLTSLNNSQYSKLQNQATQYAQQGMETMQGYRDAKSFSGLSLPAYCLNISCTPINNYASCFTPPSVPPCTLIDGNFDRRVDIYKPPDVNADPNCGTNITVAVTVKWADGKCTGGASDLCHKVKVQSCMLNSLRPTLGP